MSKREQLRNKYADEVCRELRWQIANNKLDGNQLFPYLIKWMRVGIKTKYQRPKNNNK